jgi:hypothetical protein
MTKGFKQVLYIYGQQNKQNCFLIDGHNILISMAVYLQMWGNSHHTKKIPSILKIYLDGGIKKVS